MKCFQRPEFSPCGREVVLDVIGAELAGIIEQGGEAVEPRHVGLDCQLGVNRRLEVEHGGVGVLSDPLEDLVPATQQQLFDSVTALLLPALPPDVRLVVSLEQILLPALHHHPLYHHSLEYDEAPQYPVQTDLHDGVEFGPSRACDGELHISEQLVHVLNLLVEVERLHVLAVVGVPPPGPGDGPV